MRSGMKMFAAASVAAVAVFMGSSIASAAFVDVQLPAPTLLRTIPLGGGSGGLPDVNTVTAGAVYSDVTTFSGFSVSHGGAATTTAGVLGTRILMDDIQTTESDNILNTGQFSWSISNSNATAVTARMRIRFYNADGAGGGPGTAFGGFSFAASSLPTGVSTFFTTLTAGQADLPTTAGKFWAGLFYDNSGASGTTVAQLNNLGQGLFTPPDVGSSADRDWLSTNNDAGGFLTNNPTGANRVSPFAGAPAANYGWEFVPLPEPTSMAFVGMGLVGLVSRRRRA